MREMEVVLRQHTAALVCRWCVFNVCRGRTVCVRSAAWCGWAIDPPQWLGVMDGTWKLWSRSEAWCVSSHQTAGVDGCISFSALLRLSFGGGSLTAVEFRVLFQHYWLQADRYVKESHLILRQAAVKHTPTHTSSPECVCLLNTPAPRPPRVAPPPDPHFPYRITEYNPSVRPERKLRASMKLFIHQSPVHSCMYEFIDSDYFIVLKFHLTSSHTSKSVRCLVQNCNNKWVMTAHKSLQLWFKRKCRLSTIQAL